MGYLVYLHLDFLQFYQFPRIITLLPHFKLKMIFFQIGRRFHLKRPNYFYLELINYTHFSLKLCHYLLFLIFLFLHLYHHLTILLIFLRFLHLNLLFIHLRSLIHYCRLFRLLRLFLLLHLDLDYHLFLLMAHLHCLHLLLHLSNF